MYCWIMKWRIACSIDDDKALGPHLSQHLARCLPCRNYYHAQSRTSELLSETYRENSSSIGITADTPPATKGPVRGKSWFTYATALAACLAIAMGLITTVWKTDPDAFQPEAVLNSYSEKITPKGLSVLSAALLQKSIGSEIDHISTDVREAAQFLVRCTPYDEYVTKKEDKMRL
jgi:predicted anti-sigma-YlaC factor YlaD